MIGDGDHALVQRCLGGEIDSFREIVEKYQYKINLLIYGITLNRTLAQDLTQEVFIKAYRALPRFKGKSGLYTWLYKIALNLALDTRRQEGRSPLEPLDEGEGGPETPEHLSRRPDTEVLRKELREVVQQGLKELTETQRTVILLREWEGFSYKQISKVTGSSVGTVMSRLHYAREKLGEALKRYLTDEPGAAEP